MNRFKKFLTSEDGSQVAEYGSVVAIMTGGGIATLDTLQDGLSGAFDGVTDAIGGASEGDGGGDP